MDDLQLLLEDCKDEAKLYISGEKIWIDPRELYLQMIKGISAMTAKQKIHRKQYERCKSKAI